MEDLETTEQTMSDHELLDNIRAGQTALYTVLRDRHQTRLRRAIGNLLQGDSEVDDILQDAHLRALSHVREFRGDSSFSTWVTRIAINRALTYLRRRSRLAEAVGSRDGTRDVIEMYRSRLPDPEQQAYHQELRQALHAAIESLPAPYRVVFVLREIEELGTAEVVKRLGVTEACVKTRLHRARKELQKELRALGKPQKGRTRSGASDRRTVGGQTGRS